MQNGAQVLKRSKCISICSRRGIARSVCGTDVFKDAGAARFLAAAATVDSIPVLDRLPEVIVAGRANVGKSTLLNAVLGRKDLVHTSKKAGRTKMLNFFCVGKPPGKLVLVDAPGYGMRGRSEWGELFEHYVDTRTQLRRIYLLINAKHGVTEFDKNMLQHLNDKLQANVATRAQLTLQAILTKVDTIPAENASASIKATQADIFKYAPICLPALLTAVTPKVAVGIDAVKASISEVCGV